MVRRRATYPTLDSNNPQPPRSFVTLTLNKSCAFPLEDEIRPPMSPAATLIATVDGHEVTIYVAMGMIYVAMGMFKRHPENADERAALVRRVVEALKLQEHEKCEKCGETLPLAMCSNYCQTFEDGDVGG